VALSEWIRSSGPSGCRGLWSPGNVVSGATPLDELDPDDGAEAPLLFVPVLLVSLSGRIRVLSWSESLDMPRYPCCALVSAGYPDLVLSPPNVSPCI
jgi:hypothetical protein